MRAAISMAVMAGAIFCWAAVSEGSQDRILGPVGGGRAVVLPNSVHPAVSRASERGRMEPEATITGVTLMLAPSEAQAAELERFLEAQRDPASPDYQNWLTPEQYGDRFGASENDFGAVRAWLAAAGLRIEDTARARNWVLFSGTAGDLERAFHVELHRLEMDGEAHFANTSAIQIPAALAGLVAGIRGLDDFRLKPLHTGIVAGPDGIKTDGTRPEMDAAGGVHYLAPGDFATIYDIQRLYNAGYDGTGQRVAIVGQSDINLNDLRAFRAQFNLPPRDPQLVRAGSDTGANTSDQTEATLDLEWAGAVARNATILYVYAPNVFQSLQYAIDRNLASVVSLSYGGCEMQASSTYRTLAQQANAEGITWVTAAGDSGPAGCDSSGEAQARNGISAAFPADIPEVTAVGGTEFNEGTGFYWQAQNGANSVSAVSYIPEKAWNDTALGSGLAAGGGAPSQVYAKPWWQAGAGVPDDQARDVPDLALAASGAHDAYAVYMRGELVGEGGTSAASPAFAGIVAILNQYLMARGYAAKPGLGNINPMLYNLAQNTAGAFHDVVTGNNNVPCAAGPKDCVKGNAGFSAASGYDLATGLGSVDAYNLVTKWNSIPPVTGTTMVLTAAPTSIAPNGTVQLTATITALGGSNAPAGTVSFSIGSTVLGAANLSGAGVNESASITVKGSSLATGINTVTAIYQGSSTLANRSATATIAVTAPSTAPPTATAVVLTASPGMIAQSASTILTATVRPASGTGIPGGSIVFMFGNIPLGTTNVVAGASSGIAVLAVKGSDLSIGTNTVTANYAAAANFANSSATVTITVTAPAGATVITSTAAPAAISASGASQVTVTVKASTGTAVPTGHVNVMLGTRNLGSLALINGTATGVVQGAALLPGINSMVAAYSGSSAFSASISAPFTISVTATIATSTTVSASPAVIPSTSSILLTATVTAGRGSSSAPVGDVLFAVGTTLLGNVPLTASGAAATAVLNVTGSAFSSGTNVITAVYVPTGNFASSTGVLSVKVTAPVMPTTLTVSAAPGKQPSTTVLTATVQAAGGTATPTGLVSFRLGTAFLGTATLSGAGGRAIGTLTLNNGVLSPGDNSITAVFFGSPGFSGSSDSVTVER